MSSLTSAQTYEWTNVISSSSDISGQEVVLDSVGNIYTVGYFKGTVDFDPGPGVDSRTAIGSAYNSWDIFLTKQDNSGGYLWTNIIASSGADYAWDVDVDDTGNVYIVGEFNGTADFDPTAGVDNRTATGYSDVFTTKYNSNGDMLWTNIIGSTGWDYLKAITVDNNGSVYVAGVTSGVVDFDLGVGQDMQGPGAFVVKYNSNGGYQWVNITDSAVNYTGIDTHNNNVYMIGDFNGVVDFDPSAGEDLRGGNFDVFLSKYDSNGGYEWSKDFGTTGQDKAYDISVDINGDIYIAGAIGNPSFGTASGDFDPGPGNATVSTVGGYDVYTVKFNTSGEFQWVNTFGSTQNETGHGLEISANGWIFVSGSFRGTVDFDPEASVDNKTSSPSSTPDIFVTKYDSNGVYQSTNTFGSTQYYNDFGFSIDVDSDDNIYTVGTFRGTGDFDPTVNVDSKSSSGGGYDTFIQKFDTKFPVAISNPGVGGIEVINSDNLSDLSVANVTNYNQNILVKIRSTAGNLSIAEFEVNMVQDRDWGSTVGAGIDQVEGKSYFHVPGGASTLDGVSTDSFSLYVPYLPGSDGVLVCPGAINLVEVQEGCAGGYQLSVGVPEVSLVNVDGQDYYKIDGLTGTGAKSISGVPGPLGPQLRIVIRDSEATSVSSDVEIWYPTINDITANSLIYINYEGGEFVGGSAITTSDVTVTCDTDGLDPLSGTTMTNVTVTNSDNGVLELDTGIDTCVDWIVVDINGDGGNSLTNPASSGNYSWSVMSDAGGDGVINDLGATLAYVSDDNDVLITAVVPPVLDMELYQTGLDTELTDPNTCALGVLSLNTVNTCTYDIGTGTNSSSGISVYMSADNTLDDGLGNDIDNTVGTVDAGSEEYGFYISELGGGEYIAAGSYNVAHQSVPLVNTLIATTSTVGNGTTIGQSAQRMEIEHAASMSTDTIVGSYNQLVTYTAYTN